MASLQAGMAEHLAAGDHVEGDAAEAVGDADANSARLLSEGLPMVSQDVEVVVAKDQVIGNAKDGGKRTAEYLGAWKKCNPHAK